MKNKMFLRWLPVLTAGLGLVGLGLRQWLYAAALDEKELLVLWHPLAILLWAVTAGVVVMVPLCLRGTENLRGYHRNFPHGLSSALGCFALALVMGLELLLSFRGVSPTERILGLAAAGGLILVGAERLQKKRPSPLAHGLVCVYFAVHLISQYRAWSGCPQLEDYIFPMLAGVGLMLFAYQQTAFDGGYGCRKVQLGTGMLTVYFCLVALSEDLFLYGAGAAWVLSNLCCTRDEPAGNEQEVA